MQAFLTGRRPWLVLTLLCALLYLPGQATLPPFDRDEARFAQASKQMLESGDYLVPHFQDSPRSKKPAGIYWLQAGSVALLSDADARAIWAYRVPSVLGAWTAVLLTFAIGTRLFDRRTGLAGAVLLGGSLLLAAEAHLAKTDAVLLATVLLAVWGLARCYAAWRDDAIVSGALPALAFWGGLGLAALIKGPVGPAVVGLAVIGLRFATGRWAWGRGLRPKLGVPVFAVLAGAWPLALALAGTGGFIAESANEDLIPKLLSGQESHGAPPGTYLLSLYAGFWPGSLLVIPAAVAAWRRRHDWGVRFCLAWAVPGWLMFEAVPTKLPHYVLPLYPALALLAGVVIVQGWPAARRPVWRWLARLHVAAWAVLTLALAGAFAYLPFEYADGGLWWALPPAVLLAGGAALGARHGWRLDGKRMALTAVGLAALVLPWLGEVYAPRLDRLWVARTVAEALPPPGDRPPLAAAGYHEPSLVFMAGTRTRLTSPRAVADYLVATPGGYGLVTDREDDGFAERLRAHGVEPEKVAEFDAFNYSKGDRITVSVYHRPAGR